MQKKNKLLLIGVILIAVGVFMFFKSTRILSWGFYRIGYNISTGGILITLTIVDLVLLIATQHRAAKIALPILIAMLVLSVVLGTQLYFTGTLLDLFLILAPAAVGAGLVLRVLLTKSKKEES